MKQKSKIDQTYIASTKLWIKSVETEIRELQSNIRDNNRATQYNKLQNGLAQKQIAFGRKRIVDAKNVMQTHIKNAAVK